MGLVLLNLQSNQQINLDKDNPLVIGRGNVTGCGDKRVSRSHGKITCRTDGKVTLQALHSNPCFFTKKGAGPVLQLNKNEEQVLGEGDCLGLLPNSYWYQITSESSVKDNESQDVNLESSQSTKPKTEVTPKPERSQTSGCLNYTLQKHDYAVAGPSRAREEPDVVVPAYLKNTRKLPIWLYEIKGQEDLYRTLAKTKPAISTPKTTPDLLKIEQSSSIITAILGLNSTAASTGGSKSGQDDSKDNAVASKIKPGRPYCRYGANCYRKNAQHKLEFSHPGDEDYISYQNRPMCEYGANCYRKNLAHRRQFRHASTENPQTSQGSGAPVPVASTSGAPVPVASTSGAPVPVPSTSAAPVPVASTSAAPVPVASTSAAPVPVASTSAAPVPVPSTSAAPVPVPSTSAAPVPVSSTSAAPVPVASTSAAPVLVSSTSGAPVPVPVASTSHPLYDWDLAISEEESSDSDTPKRQADSELSSEEITFAVTPEKKRRRGSSNYSSYHSSDHSLNGQFSDSSSDHYSPPSHSPKEYAKDSDYIDDRDYCDPISFFF